MDAEGKIAAALASAGLPPGRIDTLSPPDPDKRGRSAHRVILGDGRVIKARHLESIEAARDLEQAREGLEAAFPPVIRTEGRVVLEVWIDAAALSDPEAHVEEAGALLRRLHSRGAGTVETRSWRERAESELEVLAVARKLSREDTARLRAALGRHDPRTARRALVHKDFCAENMLAGDRLYVIDNEWISLDAADFDLARTFTRWPMSKAAWARFIAAYGMDPGPLDFWKIVAAVLSARMRLRKAPDRLDAALDALRGLS